MIRAVSVVFAAAALLFSPVAMAWGEYGHHTVASVAWENVRPQTRIAVRQLLKAEKGLATPGCRVRSIEEAGYWPDCIRSQSWRFAYTFPWHYQTEPVCKAYDVKANCANGNCVTGQIERSRKVLADKSLPAAERLQALAFLVHFTGDLHMPLHSGDNYDLGGNQVKATYGEAPVWNLHSLWDGQQAERSISSAQPPLVRRYSAQERAALAGGTLADWGRESWDLARRVYTRAFGRSPCDGKAPEKIVWTNEMIAEFVPEGQRRISQAGLRLADLLDEALAPR
ncbi:S1/P1 nuclease [Novosphingobium sp. TH158]|uniref:S1/P1 nuclease n=1 Tax=Novosphingobium sp. TH158 TaxID=2067455 RepID=UPI0020B11A82|nr:S1/P1 nuclease [Novosphingobium sp. TH158]